MAIDCGIQWYTGYPIARQSRKPLTTRYHKSPVLLIPTNLGHILVRSGRKVNWDPQIRKNWGKLNHQPKDPHVFFIGPLHSLAEGSSLAPWSPGFPCSCSLKWPPQCFFRTKTYQNISNVQQDLIAFFSAGFEGALQETNQCYWNRMLRTDIRLYHIVASTLGPRFHLCLLQIIFWHLQSDMWGSKLRKPLLNPWSIASLCHRMLLGPSLVASSHLPIHPLTPCREVKWERISLFYLQLWRPHFLHTLQHGRFLHLNSAMDGISRGDDHEWRTCCKKCSTWK